MTDQAVTEVAVVDWPKGEPPSYRITMLCGTLRLPPVEYWLETVVSGPWWWRRTEYFVTCDFSRLGPFRKDEAINCLLALRRSQS